MSWAILRSGRASQRLLVDRLSTPLLYKRSYSGLPDQYGLRNTKVPWLAFKQRVIYLEYILLRRQSSPSLRSWQFG